MNTDTEKAKAMQDLLDSSSESILEYLERAVPIFRDNLPVLRSANPENGMNVLIQGVEGLQLVTEYLHSASEATAADDKPLSRNYGEISAKVREAMELIIDAMEKKDMALLADVMEFELIESLGRLQELLGERYGDH